MFIASAKMNQEVQQDHTEKEELHRNLFKKDEIRGFTVLGKDEMCHILKYMQPTDVRALRSLSPSINETVMCAINDRLAHTQPSNTPIAYIDRDHLYDLVASKLFKSERSLVKGTQLCLGSFEGWLIVIGSVKMEANLSVSFLNPLTVQEIVLPTKLPTPQEKIVLPNHDNKSQHKAPYYPDPSLVKKAVLSSHPLAYVSFPAGHSDSTPYLAVLMRDGHQIAVYKHISRSWTVIKADSGHVFTDIEIVGEHLFIGSCSGQSSGNLLRYNLTSFDAQAEVIPFPPGRRGDFFIGKDELLNNLYLVYMLETHVRENGWRKTSHSFLLFKLEEDFTWQEVSMTRKTLFLSQVKSIIRERTKRIRGNTIFFDARGRGGHSKFGKLVMNNKGQREYKDFQFNLWKQRPYANHVVWFVPCY